MLPQIDTGYFWRKGIGLMVSSKFVKCLREHCTLCFKAVAISLTEIEKKRER